MEIRQIHSSIDDSYIGYADSRIGGRSENQDNCGYMDTKFGLLVTVCDGMGGGPGGRTASTIAVQTILDSIEVADEKNEICDIVSEAVKKANGAIYNYGIKNPSYRGMGSTATVLLLSNYSACVAHVGDSRIYQVRNGYKVFRTFDHSKVFGFVRQGMITEEQARLSVESNVITRALGIGPNVDVDVIELSYEKGDRFVLCTDGVHGTMPEIELLRFLGNKKCQLSAVVDDTLAYVDSLGRNSGGHHDNMTLAIVETKNKSKYSLPMSTTNKIIMAMLTLLCVVSIAINVFLYQNTLEAKRSLIDADSISTWIKRDSTNIATIKCLRDSITNIKKSNLKNKE